MEITGIHPITSHVYDERSAGSRCPEEKLVPDYAGFRTFDSVIRAQKVFMQILLPSFTKISSGRAIYIADHNGIKAYGFAADFPQHQGAFQVLVREYLARVRMMLDVYILQTQPHFWVMKSK